MLPANRLPLRASLFVAIVAGFMASATSAAQAACDGYASPSGSVQRMVNSLRPGQTGCLYAGTYYANVVFPRGGRAGAPITLTSVPGDVATIVGRMWVPQQSDYVDVTFLHLDGRNSQNLPSPSVASAHDQFIFDDVTDDHTGICFELGSNGYGQAVDTLIQGNRIHGCGVMPPTNHQHGIYVANSVGAQILNNVIYNNADRGIQLYWDAQQTTIAGNVIDHNGEGVAISGDDGYVSSNNRIVNNVITNSTQRTDVSSWWPDPSHTGVGNVVEGNCIHGGRGGAIDTGAGGFTALDNLYIDPGYANAAAGNYALQPGSRCAAVLAGATPAGASHYQARAKQTQTSSVAFKWLHAKLRRRRGQGVLVLAGRLACPTPAPKYVLVDVYIHHRTGWQGIASIITRGCNFRLKRAVGHVGRRLTVRLRAYPRNVMHVASVVAISRRH